MSNTVASLCPQSTSSLPQLTTLLLPHPPPHSLPSVRPTSSPFNHLDMKQTQYQILVQHVCHSVFFLSFKAYIWFTQFVFCFQEHKSAKTVGEVKQYVQRIPYMQRAKASLATRELQRTFNATVWAEKCVQLLFFSLEIVK